MSLYEGLKDAINFAKNANNSDVMQKLIDVQTLILEMQQQMLELHEKNKQLKDENEKLQNSAAVSKNVILFKGFVYDKANPLNRGPFCMTCWENNRKLIPIVSIDSRAVSVRRPPLITCNACKSQYSNLPSEDEVNALMINE